jgi:hypothetical protein
MEVNLRDMEANIWQNLPEDILFKILARLPIRVLVSLKSVCKQWNSLLSSSMGNPLQIMDPNLPLRSTPGFFVQLDWGLLHGLHTWVIEGHDTQIYKVRLPIIVKDVSKSVVCATHLPHVYLRNPATGTWRHLTLPSREGQDPLRLYFHAMAFDVSTRRCTVIVGEHNDGPRRINKLTMEIYDSESDAWTRVSTPVHRYARPQGPGIHSQGKFYWCVPSGESTYRLVVFTVADRTWKLMLMPRVHNYQLNLAGFHIDGRLVLFGNYFDGNYDYSMYLIWKLNEGAGVGRNGYEWCQWHLDLPRDIVFCQIWVNNSRCILWNLMELKLHICNDDGRLMRQYHYQGHRSLEEENLVGF